MRNRAEDIVSMADRIEQEFVSLNDITGGELYFGLAESYQISFFARELRSFKKNYPGLRYYITSGDTEQVAEKLDKGLLDFVVLAEIPDAAKYEYLAFPEEDVCGLVFRLLTPRLETKLFLVWKKYQAFSPIAERFLRQIQASFSVNQLR